MECGIAVRNNRTGIILRAEESMNQQMKLSKSGKTKGRTERKVCFVTMREKGEKSELKPRLWIVIKEGNIQCMK